MGSSSTYTGGVNCHNSKNGRPKQAFVGWMMYNRYWFKKDLYAVTLGGGQMNNPGRYLTLLPPINGATAITGTPYFTENAGDRAQMHDGTITFDYMPSQFITFRLGARLSLLRRAVLDWPRRHHPSRLRGRPSHQQWSAFAVCLRQRCSIRFRLRKPDSG